MELDKEWLTLILEAKKMGFDKDEIRDFFKEKGTKDFRTDR
ncbi:anti-repressor SinI family protein [Bacillus sp. FJAT-49732]|uniref:Anti-repressor SinI family protein n=1 Tax=Lederbergia citrisecunda TaxID=2833583 RepID=A0A942TPQ5_9BACI|nr:anti-repressor SinI family protein [Lederbergia citrisecunda]MBS4202286.1 anti-repressor SinI family protein [Lederbergia citrisecunda]